MPRLTLYYQCKDCGRRAEECFESDTVPSTDDFVEASLRLLDILADHHPGHIRYWSGVEQTLTVVPRHGVTLVPEHPFWAFRAQRAS